MNFSAAGKSRVAYGNFSAERKECLIAARATVLRRFRYPTLRFPNDLLLEGESSYARRRDGRWVCEPIGPYEDAGPAQRYDAPLYRTGFPADHSGGVLCSDRAITGPRRLWGVRDGGGYGCSAGTFLGARHRQSLYQECALRETGSLDLLG